MNIGEVKKACVPEEWEGHRSVSGENNKSGALNHGLPQQALTKVPGRSDPKSEITSGSTEVVSLFHLTAKPIREIRPTFFQDRDVGTGLLEAFRSTRDEDRMKQSSQPM